MDVTMQQPSNKNNVQAHSERLLRSTPYESTFAASRSSAGAYESTFASSSTTRGKYRLEGLDLMRGLIMIVMSWDHAKDYIADQSVPKNKGSEMWSGPLASKRV